MDYYYEDLEDGKDVERPYIFGIKKGKKSLHKPNVASNISF